jgi:hypothetical protein
VRGVAGVDGVVDGAADDSGGNPVDGDVSAFIDMSTLVLIGEEEVVVDGGGVAAAVVMGFMLSCAGLYEVGR